MKYKNISKNGIYFTGQAGSRYVKPGEVFKEAAPLDVLGIERTRPVRKKQELPPPEPKEKVKPKEL